MTQLCTLALRAARTTMTASRGAALLVATSLVSANAQVTPVEIEAGDATKFGARVLTTGLSNPWAMRWGPDGMIWVTERTSGEVTRVDPESGAQQVLVTLVDVYTGPQHEGLLGLALHPDFLQDKGTDYVYLGYTVNNGTAETPDPAARIVRYTYDATQQILVEPTILIDNLPAWNDHNAGRVVFGPDGKIYYSIGEQGANFGRNQRRPNLAQALPDQAQIDSGDWTTYSGKILRLNPDGSIPEDNPVINGVKSHIYSYGHRNPQGLAFGPDGTLYEAEHGPASDDELNIIQPGGNYGWPRVAGRIDDKAYTYINWSEAPPEADLTVEPVPDTIPQFPESAFTEPMVDPIATFWTVEDDYPIGDICGYICDPTMAPSSVLYYAAGTDGITEWDNSLLIPTLKHGTLYVQKLAEDGMSADGPPVAWLSTQNRYRDVIVAPDNRTVFIATDAFGSAAQKFGEGLNTSVLHNPGAILMFTYGASGGGLGQARAPTPIGELQAAASSGTSEWSDPATGKTAGGNEEEPASVTEESNISDVAALGAPKYAETCAVCHGPAGRSDNAKVLADNPKLADDTFTARTILHGYGYMPAFKDKLGDNDIAEIATFIRNSWGNDFGVLTTQEVEDQRQ
ncbi:glucose/sorbosone family PQQ-dependent dehydrogenase [Tabrizicola sp.]|uniref:glucose/sorbosone family PQQ-dependent dehydrogenase n=1 Tax=Tabrizicola sp. TaxID=2005166 RepID=UPI0035B2DAF7